MEPFIGIVVCGFTQDRQFVTNPYIQSVRYGGGVPIVVPLVRSDRLISQYVSLCDGFLFCGGGDITPLLFGEEPAFGNGATDITVDLFQLRLMRQVIDASKPVLAICRGMQVLCAACGGTIWQDLSLIPQKTLNHTQQSSSRREVSHMVSVSKGTRLRQIVGPTLYVNSFHHQAVREVGKGVRVSAKAKDGVIEGVELKNHPFAVGVQWHPECMYRSCPQMRSLFHDFISHCTPKSRH